MSEARVSTEARATRGGETRAFHGSFEMLLLNLRPRLHMYYVLKTQKHRLQALFVVKLPIKARHEDDSLATFDGQTGV